MIEKWDSRYKRFIETAFREVKRVLHPYSGRFSKRTYTQHQHAVAILLMKYEKKTYRDIIDLLKETWRYFKFKGAIPHFTTLQKFFARVSSGIWDFILTKTYQLFGIKEANVAIDSTGFSENYGPFYYYMRIDEFGNKQQFRRRKFMKHSVVIDTDTQAVIASVNSQSYRHDTSFSYLF